MHEKAGPCDELNSLVVRTVALLCVQRDGRHISWNDASHFDDETMRARMRQVVDRLHSFQKRLEDPRFLDRTSRWMDLASCLDEPKLDESLLPGAATKRDAGR